MAVYNSILSAMKFDAGFDIDLGSFAECEEKFQNIVALFTDDGLRKLMTYRIKLPVQEIKEWVLTATASESSLSGSISGQQIVVSPTVLNDVFGFANGDEDFAMSDEEFTSILTEMGFSGSNPNKILKK